MKRELDCIISYLDSLTLDYSQLCQRSDSSIYGIASGKQCRKGREIALKRQNQERAQLSRAIKDAKAKGASMSSIREAIAGNKTISESIDALNTLKVRSNSPKTLVNLAVNNHKDTINKIERYLQLTDGKTIQDVANDIFYAKKALKNSYSRENEEILAKSLIKIKAIKEAEKLMTDLRKGVVSKGSAEDAKQLTMDVLRNSPTKDLPYPTREYARTLYELNRATNSKITDLEKLYYSDPRAYSIKKGDKIQGEENDRTGRINVGLSDNPSSLKKDLWHEFGHQVEDSIPEYREAATEWLKSRSNGGQLVRLRDLGPEFDQYGADEYVYRGDFFSEYVGKYYPDGATEVISTGLEMFYSPRTMTKLYQQDPEHFFLILGILDQL